MRSLLLSLMATAVYLVNDESYLLCLVKMDLVLFRLDDDLNESWYAGIKGNSQSSYCWINFNGVQSFVIGQVNPILAILLGVGQIFDPRENMVLKFNITKSGKSEVFLAVSSVSFCTIVTHINTTTISSLTETWNSAPRHHPPENFEFVVVDGWFMRKMVFA